MKTMELKQAILWAFGELKGKILHVSQIAEKISMLPDYQKLDSEEVKAKVNALLASDVKSKHPAFAHAKNPKTGANARGMYKLLSKKSQPIIKADGSKKQKVAALPPLTDVQSTLFPPPQTGQLPFTQKQNTKTINNPIPDPTPIDGIKPESSFLGKAGEHAVVSELLMRGYQAGIIAVDKGIDISAIKNEKLFLIQVKTTWFKDNKITATVKTDNFTKNSANNVFYVIVFRYKYNGAFFNQYLVFNSYIIEHFMQNNLISKGSKNENLTIKIKQENGHLYIYNDNKQDIIDKYLNGFDQIK